MQVLRKLRRPRWLAAVALVAVVGAGRLRREWGGAGREARRDVTGGPGRRPDYIYGQLFNMAYNDVYRVSGADGTPTQPGHRRTTCRPTINGWQEFFQQWKSQLTDTKAMGTSRSSRPSPTTTSAAHA